MNDNAFYIWLADYYQSLNIDDPVQAVLILWAICFICGFGTSVLFRFLEYAIDVFKFN